MTLEEAEQDRLDLIRSYNQCFLGPNGKLTHEGFRVLEHLLKMAGWPKGEACVDTNILLLREGAGQVVGTVFRILNLDPTQALLRSQLNSYDPGN